MGGGCFPPAMTGFARIAAALFVLAMTAAFVPQAAAQDDEDLPEYRYIPRIELTKEDRQSLESEKDLRRYTRLAIGMMEARLSEAEKEHAESDFRAATDLLGRFEAVLNASLGHLTANAAGRRSLDNLKRFEIALRGFTPRIETLRRELPDTHQSYVLRLLRAVRDARTRSIEPFFGETDNRQDI